LEYKNATESFDAAGARDEQACATGGREQTVKLQYKHALGAKAPRLMELERRSPRSERLFILAFLIDKGPAFLAKPFSKENKDGWT
jgi:hypothetical protein